MRKTIVIALVALLVMLAVASCDNSGFGLGADRLVTLSVNTGGTAGNSRSITDTSAKAEANTIEVIVKSGTEYYRAVGRKGDDISLRVPAGTYNNTNTLLLIGRKDGTLLAIGTATNAVTLPWTSGDKTLTLTATSLTTTLTAGVSGCNFVIDASSVDSTDFPLFAGKLDKGSVNDGPCFQVPTGFNDPAYSNYVNGIKASLTFNNTNLASIGTNIIVKSTANQVKFTPFVTGMPAINPIVTSISNFGAGKIAFEFDTTTAGEYRITFDLQVVGFSEDYVAGRGTEPLTWHIKGGTDTGVDYGDDGSLKTATREGVPLIVTDAPTSQSYSLPGTIGYW